MAFVFAILMWGVVYQGYNAVFPSFYQELFPTKTRVTAFAVSQNLGTLITAFLPAIYAAIAGPAPGACVVDKKFAAGRRAAVGRDLPGRGGRDRDEGRLDRGHASPSRWRSSRPIAAFTARETFRVHMNDLGNKDAVPVPKDEYDRIRATGVDTPV